MPRILVLIAVSIAVALAGLEGGAAATGAPAQVKGKHRLAKSRTGHKWHGYGFLPGYRPPEEIAIEREFHDYRRGRFYAVPWPRFYRGRWNGGGFGPCYTWTPIGPIWNCGR